jgi:hypothetical protein
MIRSQNERRRQIGLRILKVHDIISCIVVALFSASAFIAGKKQDINFIAGFVALFSIFPYLFVAFPGLAVPNIQIRPSWMREKNEIDKRRRLQGKCCSIMLPYLLFLGLLFTSFETKLKADFRFLF